VSQRRDLEARLALYDDLAGILGAMRSFALAELHRIGQREVGQQQTAQALAAAFAELAGALPAPHAAAADVWVLLGSVRGFCSSFNEDVLRVWHERGRAARSVVAVGERLQALLPPDLAATGVAGALGAADAAGAIDRILAALAPGADDVGLLVCLRDDEGARVERLLPLAPAGASQRQPPMTFEAPARVAAGVAQHLLFHRLLALLLRSLRVENHMRLMQMENALQHLERGSDELQRARNQLRQGEIIEEIELILRDRTE